MIVFGTCVESDERYEQRSLPSIRSVLESDGRILIVENPTSISGAYNDLIRQAREIPESKLWSSYMTMWLSKTATSFRVFAARA